MIPVKALTLVKQFEGCKLKAYKCPADVWTIGYGHTGEDVVEGLEWTQAQADAQLAVDLDKFSKGVDGVCPSATPLQRGAMCALAYNIGLGAFKKSSVARLHNQGRYAEAAQAFGLWNKAGGKVLAGLVKRRAAEAALYLEQLPDAPETVPETIKAEGEKPSRTIAGASIGGGAVVASQVTEAISTLDYIKDQLYQLTPYLPIASKALVVIGLIGIGYAIYCKWQDKKSGRS